MDGFYGDPYPSLDPRPVLSPPSFKPSYFDRATPVTSVLRPRWAARGREPPVNGDDPSGWTRFIHPEEGVYWVHYHQYGSRAMPIYTFAHLGDQGIREEVEKFRDAILGNINPKSMPLEWELVLELDIKGGLCGYYFIDCSESTLFWLHEVDAAMVLGALPDYPVSWLWYLGSNALFWNHWEVFPCGRDVTEDIWKTLSGIIADSGFNDTTSNVSTSVHVREEIQKCISRLERVRLHGGKNGESACVVGRLMKLFIYGGYVKPPGLHEDRSCNDRSVFGNKDKPPLLTKSLSVWLNFVMGCVLMRQLLSGPL